MPGCIYISADNRWQKSHTVVETIADATRLDIAAGCEAIAGRIYRFSAPVHVVSLCELDAEEFNCVLSATKKRYLRCIDARCVPNRPGMTEDELLELMDSWRELLAQMEADPRYRENLAGPKIKGWVTL